MKTNKKEKSKTLSSQEKIPFCFVLFCFVLFCFVLFCFFFFSATISNLRNKKHSGVLFFFVLVLFRKGDSVKD